MTVYHSAGGAAFGLLAAAPWVVATVYFWRRRIRDGAIAPSPGEIARRRFTG